ncbi:MAG: hypothetical protein ACLFUB_10650 [Cyclobacteriaceae bacterium]
MKTFLTIVLMLTLLMGLGLKKAWGQEPVYEPPLYDVFASLMYEYATIDGMPRQSRGLGAALLFNGQTFLGFYGTSLREHSHLALTEGNVRHALQGIRFDQMGLWLGYIHQPEKRLHMMIHTQLGTGGVSYEKTEEGIIPSAQVFVVNPQLALQLNVTRWLSLSAGLGYRWVSDPYAAGFEDVDFGNISSHIQLRIGGFNR